LCNKTTSTHNTGMVRLLLDKDAVWLEFNRKTWLHAIRRADAA